MTTTTPIALILGAGPNIVHAVSRLFASKGYKIALASRTPKHTDDTGAELHITNDFSAPEDVVKAFAQVKQSLGIPSVVVYNASSATFTPADDPFALDLKDLEKDTTVNIFSAFIAAQQAVLGFRQLPPSSSRTFIYTGNILNVVTLPKFLSQGIGKSGAAHMIWAVSEAYKEQGYKFYYADERKGDGAPKYRVDGEAHAELYWGLAAGKQQGPWMQTFVKGLEYKEFETMYTSLK